MKILYMSHRYHTNQNTIMKGWIENGDQVYFLSQYAGKTEDYTYVTPNVVGYSLLFRIFYFIYVNYIGRKNPTAMDIRLKIGFPPMFRLWRTIKNFNPDVVIMRERSVYTICMTAICRLMHYPVILYVMNPVWDVPKRDIAHRIVWKLVPKYRMTPSLVYGRSYEGKVEDPYAYYAPYLMEPQTAPEEKSYFPEGLIRILEVGKFVERKNHWLMVKAVEKLSANYDIRLTIVGECSSHFHQEYLDGLQQYIDKQKLGQIISIKKNLHKAEMMLEYKNADVFVLPSTGEPGSVTNLEGMAFSIPVVCGEDNGTACYVIEGKTGFVFKDNDLKDLSLKIEKLLEHKELIKEMGRNSYEHVKKNFQFNSYQSCVKEILEKQRKRD